MVSLAQFPVLSLLVEPPRSLKSYDGHGSPESLFHIVFCRLGLLRSFAGFHFLTEPGAEGCGGYDSEGRRLNARRPSNKKRTAGRSLNAGFSTFRVLLWLFLVKTSDFGGSGPGGIRV